MPHSRRQFVKYFALGVASSSVLGRHWQNPVLAAVRSSAETGPGKFTIKLSDFPALQEENGSVRFGFTQIDGDLPPNNGYYPIIINRGSGNTFYALDAECRHQSCTVRPYRSEFDGLPCFCHGSLYAIDGTSFAGPAFELGLNLRTFPTSFDNTDTLTVLVPSWGFALASIAKEGQRFKLEFPTIFEAKYKVEFRSSVAGANWSAVNFASTPDGPLTETELTGNGLSAAVYVEPIGQQGYFAAVAQVVEAPPPPDF